MMWLDHIVSLLLIAAWTLVRHRIPKDLVDD